MLLLIVYMKILSLELPSSFSPLERTSEPRNSAARKLHEENYMKSTTAIMEIFFSDQDGTLLFFPQVLTHNINDIFTVPGINQY